MQQDWQNVVITRAGSPILGSPFAVKVRYRRLHVDPQIAPIASRRPIQEFLIFQSIHADIRVGDFVSLPDRSLTKIVDVRAYACSLQCMLQRLPYVSMPLWVPSTVSRSIASDKSLIDVAFTSSGSILGLIEPHGIDQSGPLPVGHIDRRSAWIFTTQSVNAQSIIVNNVTDYWLVTATSSVWPVSQDYRAPVRRLAIPPLGVS